LVAGCHPGSVTEPWLPYEHGIRHLTVLRFIGCAHQELANHLSRFLPE
jgi:hypothetical protein